MPALAVAEALRAKLPGVELLYVGSKRPEDRRLVESAGVKFVGISTGKLRRYFSLENVADLFRFWWGLGEAGRILRRFRPQVIFAKGGYVPLPVVLAAKKLEIPVVVHESDSHLGLANRLALRSAKKLAVAWPIQTYWQNESRLGKFADKFVYVGLPIAKELLEWRGEKLFNNDLPTILITGGSQGAHAINAVVSEILSKLLAHYNVVHQVGSLDIEAAEDQKRNLAPEHQERYLPFSFDRKFFLAGLHQADLVVSRSGSFIFELAALGKAAVLLPLLGSANDHQRKNGARLAQDGVAVMIAPEVLSGEGLMNTIRALMMDNKKRMEMASKMRRLGDVSRTAAETIADLIIATADEKTN